MEDFYDVYVPENSDYLLSDPEEDEPPPEPEAPEEEPSEPEPEAPEEELSEPEPEAPEEELSEPEPENPEEPVPEEPLAEPETLSAGETEDGSETMKDLISAIGDLNETIIGAVTEEPEEQPEEPSVLEESGGAGGAAGGGGLDGALPGVDLTSVVELLGDINDNLVMQHNALLQVQANLDFVFLAVAALIGVVLGVAVGRVFHDLWRV